MMTGINMSKTFGSFIERINRSLKGFEKESLYNFSPEEEQQRQRTMDGYAIGKILVDLNVITPKQLEEVLQRQWELQSLGRKRSLGVLLVEMGLTTSKIYLDRLSQHFNMPVFSLNNYNPIPSFQTVIGFRYADRHKVVVGGHDEYEVKFALADPTPLIPEELRKLLKRKRVNFYLANPFEVERCLRRYSDPYSENFYR